MTESFSAVFSRLGDILRPYGDDLICTRDDAEEYYLNTAHIMKNKKPLFFGAAKVGKNYVSFHLMPVYVFPDLLDDVSPELTKRMQGKSCFNFTSIEPGLISELEALTQAGYERYRERNMFAAFITFLVLVALIKIFERKRDDLDNFNVAMVAIVPVLVVFMVGFGMGMLVPDPGNLVFMLPAIQIALTFILLWKNLEIPVAKSLAYTITVVLVHQALGWFLTRG